MSKFLKSAQALKKRVGATDEEMQMYLKAVVADRSKKYSQKLANKYPLSLQRKAQDYFNSLSPLEQAELGPQLEAVLDRAVEENPDAFTAEEIHGLFGKDGQRKPLTPDPFDAPIRDVDRGRWMDGAGDLVEAPPENPVKEVRVASDQELLRMDSQALKKIAKAHGMVEEELD
jgi:hypothetical protein